MLTRPVLLVRWFGAARSSPHLFVQSRRRSARTGLACGFLVMLAATLGMTAAVETVKPQALRNHWLAARVAPWHAQRLVLMSHWLPRWVPWSGRVDFQWDLMEPDGFTPFPHANPTAQMRATMTAHARQEYVHEFAAF